MPQDSHERRVGAKRLRGCKVTNLKALFPIFSLAREKIGPPEARQKRPRRNESLQARLLILCARFFLSKPQTEFAVWVLSQICDNLSVSAAPSQHPYPFCPFGTFPPVRGNRPFSRGLGTGGHMGPPLRKRSFVRKTIVCHLTQNSATRYFYIELTLTYNQVIPIYTYGKRRDYNQ